MSNILHDMNTSLIRYCEVISRVVEAAVSVVDDQQIRVVWKGKKWKFQPGVCISESGNIVRTTIQSQKTQVMLEHHGHPACQTCQGRDECEECVEIWTPILANQKCLGALGFVCETKRQQQRFLREKDTFIAFLEGIADLIAIEAIQQMKSESCDAVIELLEAVVEKLDSGVMVLDEAGMVLRLNKMGRSILQEAFSNLGDAPMQVEATGRQVNLQNEYLLSDGSRKYAVAGSLHTVDAGPFYRVLIFNDAKLMRNRLSKGSVFRQITGTSHEIQTVRTRIQNAASSPSSVLIYAEDGLGKEMYARAIHDESDRWDKPFVTVDCADLPDQDPEPFLFGFTPSSNMAGSRGKAGQIENASGGTLFLNNVGALPPHIQRRLIQLLEKKEIIRVGSKRPRKVNVRVIASTNRDLSQACEEGTFRRDLLYLLNVIPIKIPPLRNRREDIRPLAVSFIQFFSKELDKPVAEVQEDFWKIVEHYDWPGNARELRSAMEYAVNMMDYPNVLSPQLLPKRIQPEALELPLAPMEFHLERVEQTVIQRALQLQREQKLTNEEIARMLGIGVATFYRKLKKFHLN